MPILSKYLEADGKTIKQQYVTADNGVEHNHNLVRLDPTRDWLSTMTLSAAWTVAGRRAESKLGNSIKSFAIAIYNSAVHSGMDNFLNVTPSCLKSLGKGCLAKQTWWLARLRFTQRASQPLRSIDAAKTLASNTEATEGVQKRSQKEIKFE
eukprot:177001-Amphidinium_carterae.7